MAGVGRDLCGSPSPTPCPSRVTHSRLQRTLSRQVLNISREGDSTASLGSLGQGSVTLRGKKFFLMFRWKIVSGLPKMAAQGSGGAGSRTWVKGAVRLCRISLAEEALVSQVLSNTCLLHQLDVHPASWPALNRSTYDCSFISVSEVGRGDVPSK